MNKEYEDRLQVLQSYLEQENIEVAMVTSPANVFYYTGFNCEPHERFMALVVDNRSNNISLFVPALDEESASNESSVRRIIPVSDEENPFAKLKLELGEHVGNFGLEMKAVNIFDYHNLRSAYAHASYVDVQPFINTQRMKKSGSEVESVRTAIDIIEKVLAEGIKKVEVGMSELELTAELEYLMRKFGADGPSFSTIVLSGEKAALPHGTPGNRTFKKGDFLLIDFGVIKDGYCSDITRTFIIGEASDKQKEIYNIVLQSNNAGINAIKSGIPVKTFDIEARNVIDEKGYGEYFNNRVGHGLGIEVHEEPSIHENNEQIAEPGLLFTIEPGIYIPEYGGVRIEDDVYLNDEGNVEVLTSFPKELQVIGK
ncbi:peptidase M24 family protein [Virgibacillus phasianinus]|uniref:Peptidase M24 family protein n=1 Tax=Virgibacillus phasianinus TaxID=2017483 RepID=A0A220U8E2_9BACI|nr:Xaa-Pro peptidase family protein [Virgibacillus phasianinus]ASK64370.1 peptidase M24 family protein [Virgibacillus phasianinus]